MPDQSAEDEAVHISAYDPSWPAKFEAERADLRSPSAPGSSAGSITSGALPSPACPPSRSSTSSPESRPSTTPGRASRKWRRSATSTRHTSATWAHPVTWTSSPSVTPFEAIRPWRSVTQLLSTVLPLGSPTTATPTHSTRRPSCGRYLRPSDRARDHAGSSTANTAWGLSWPPDELNRHPTLRSRRTIPRRNP
jgi:hypothetical protein